MGKKILPLSDQIRHAVKTCGQSQYAICKATGINKATMSRFVAGVRGLPMDTLDILANHLNLRIIREDRSTKKG